jgi:ribosomal protein S18 acetylase RimI-like enzyme
MQGQGLGNRLMANAIIRSMDSSAAWAIMVVDAKDEKASEFYKHFLFASLMDDLKHLYVRKTDIAAFIFPELELVNPQPGMEEDEKIKTASLSLLERLKNYDR